LFDSDLHIHTKYSFDSFLEPKTAVKTALKKNLSAIAITDHNTIKGSLAALENAPSNKDLLIITGSEIKTDLGDVIGLFLQKEILSRTFFDVIEEIKAQGGLVILPHPCKHHKKVSELFSRVDAFEALNGRTSRTKNNEASKLGLGFNRAMLASSDAHFSFEIGDVRTRFLDQASSSEEFRDIIYNGKRQLIGQEMPFLVHGLSLGVEYFKRATGLG
jgi:predicted metal-dependent phosphoesterase TrpH